MLFSVFSFLAGIIVIQQLTELPGLNWILGLVLATLFLAFLRFWRLMFFVAGLLWAIYCASLYLADRLPDHLQGQQIEVTGEVIGLPDHDERRGRFDFRILKPKNNFPEKVRINWFFPDKQILPGQTWNFTVKLNKPYGRFNPGAFDYERWLFMQNIGAIGYVKKKPQPQLIAEDLVVLNFSSIRQQIANNLNELVGSADFIGIIKALTLGERSDISQKQWEVFRKTGTVHLLAISGLHIGLISGLAYFLVLHSCIRLKVNSPQTLAAIFAIFIALFYSALAGFSLPTQRALIMLSIAMLTRIWQRNILPRNTIALALLVILIVDPFAVLSAGFWLSFLAVVLIVYSWAGRLGKLSYWLEGIKIHWVTAIGLAPLLLFYFQQISIISPLANFLTVPVISLLVVPLCLVAVMLMFVSIDIAQSIFELINKILQGLWMVLVELSDFPFSVVTLATPSFYAVALAVVGVFVILAPKGIPARWLGLVLILPMLFTPTKKPKEGEVSMTLLDVGQGLSAVVETTRHVLVFDAGAKYSSEYDMGDAVVIPFLKTNAIKRVDIMLISHGDNDHIGGAYSILEQIEVNQILTSVPNKFEENKATECLAGQTWFWDQVKFEILSPQQGYFALGNNNSCVLKVSSKDGSILLTGDIEQPAEEWLVNNVAEQLKSDLLVAPHHGSNTSSSLPFLEYVDPNIVLIPAGYNNRFSFPHKNVLSRYKEINTKWLSIADEGALIVKSENNQWVVRSVRKEFGRYWNN